MPTYAFMLRNEYQKISEEKNIIIVAISAKLRGGQSLSVLPIIR